MKKKGDLIFAIGFLLIFLGAMPLNGYFGYILDPDSFHKDAFNGSVWHLLIGALPFVAGILFLAFSRASIKQILLIPLCSIPLGLFMALPSIIRCKNHYGLSVTCFWLSTAIAGIAFALLIRTVKLRMEHNQRIEHNQE